MKMSEIYTKAAEQIFYTKTKSQHRCGCAAIVLSSRGLTDLQIGALLQPFAVVFRPIPSSCFWFGDIWSKSTEVNGERASHRIFALLLMAELAKDQGL